MESSEVKYTCEQLIHFIKFLPQHMKLLSEQRSHVDQELSDVQHECELTSLNACQMVKMWKQQKEILTRRRKIKNEQELLRKFEDVFDCEVETVGKLREVVKYMSETKGRQKERKYKPRVLQGLKCEERSLECVQ